MDGKNYDSVVMYAAALVWKNGKFTISKQAGFGEYLYYLVRVDGKEYSASLNIKTCIGDIIREEQVTIFKFTFSEDSQEVRVSLS